MKEAAALLIGLLALLVVQRWFAMRQARYGEVYAGYRRRTRRWL